MAPVVCALQHCSMHQRFPVVSCVHWRAAGTQEWEDRFGSEPRKGADILVQALEREGVRQLFAYPGGASMEIHQALTRSPLIRNILCRHEQARRSGLVLHQGLSTSPSPPGLSSFVAALCGTLACTGMCREN